MLTLEETNLMIPRYDSVPGLGWTLVLAEGTSDDALKNIIDVWKIVASIPRLCDEQDKPWPLPEEISPWLPKWMAPEEFSSRNIGFDTWCEDIGVEVRGWIWWSSRRCSNGRIRINLKVEGGMPMSDWTLWAVTQIAGAETVYRDVEHLCKE